MTGSNLAWLAMEVSAVVDIGEDYKKKDDVAGAKLAIVGQFGRLCHPTTNYGFFGAFRYLSMKISKYSNSLPFASRTPVISKSPPASGDEMSSTSKNRNPDCVACGSTALAANCDDSISCISFWLIAPLTFPRGMGMGSGTGLVFACGFDRRR